MVKKVLQLHTLNFVVDDVLNISAEKYGKFDIILCLGILYHIDAPVLSEFIAKMFSMCDRAVIIDTHIASASDAPDNFTWNGTRYTGKSMKEHPEQSSLVDKLERKWASLENNFSFWPTKASLINLFADCGFTSIYEIEHPYFVSYSNRLMLAAVKGQPYGIHYPQEILERVNSARQPDDCRAPAAVWGRHQMKPRASIIERVRSRCSRLIGTLRTPRT